MGSTIYYFSATGNSLAIARQMAKRLGDCSLQSMAAEPPEGPVGGLGQSIGFVFPVFYIGLPRLVKRFAERLQILEGTYCFAFATFGGMAVDTLGMLEDVLKEKGAHLSYAAGTKMPGNYVIEYPAAAPDEVQKLLKDAIDQADAAAGAIAQGKAQPVERHARLLSGMANRLFLYKGVAKWDEKFHTTDRCTSCGLCAKVCPVGNIRIEDGRPHWQHHCERCVACIQWCPFEAIEYGKATAGRRRYRNPDITAEDIIKQKV